MRHPTFDHTLQEGNRWLAAVSGRLHLDAPCRVCSALRATLHALRDRLPPEPAGRV